MAQSWFFDKFPSFDHRPNAPILEEFQRLAQSRGWRKRSVWSKQRRQCLLAEFEFHFGSIETAGKLAGWQNLCVQLGIDHAPNSITQCKKALKAVHVNILDAIDCRRQSIPIHTFASYRALVEYTRDNERFFPLFDAKEDDLIKILLRGINE